MSDHSRSLGIALTPFENRPDIIQHTAVRADELEYATFNSLGRANESNQKGITHRE
jgi:hypothetical protein